MPTEPHSAVEEPTPMKAEDSVFWDYWFLDDGILRIHILRRLYLPGIILLFFPALYLDVLFAEAMIGLALSAFELVLFVVILFVLPFAPTTLLLLWYPYLKRRAIMNQPQEEQLKPPNQLIPWTDVSSIHVGRRHRVVMRLKNGRMFQTRLQFDEDTFRSFVRDKIVKEQTLTPTGNSQVQPYVCGIGSSNTLFVLDEKGITAVRMPMSRFLFLVAGAVAASLVSSTVLDLSSWVPLVMLFLILSLPIYEELSLRTTWRLSQLPPSDLISQTKSVTTLSWSFLPEVRLVGNTLVVRNGRWTGFNIILERGVQDKTRDFLRSRMPDRLKEKPPGRFSSLLIVYVILGVFALGSLIFIVASVLPFFPGEQSHYTALLASTRAALAGASPPKTFALIFLNNIQVALSDGFPLIGQIGFALSSYNTGRVLQVIALQDAVSPYTVLQALYALPHTWLETLSYAVAVAISLRAYVSVLGRAPTLSDRLRNWRVRPYARLTIGYAGVTIMLAVAAGLETVEPFLGSAAYLLWVPIVAFALWYTLNYFRSTGENVETSSSA